jgi:cold shock CspA family protein
MPKGTIRQVMDRGLGFIRTEDGEDIIFHRNDFEDMAFPGLKIGQEVTFDIGQDRTGRPQAVNVRLIKT